MAIGPKICIIYAGIAAVAVMCSAVLLHRCADVPGAEVLAGACVLMILIPAVLLHKLRRNADSAGSRYDAPWLLACLVAGAIPLTVAPALLMDRGSSDASVDFAAVCCIAFFGAMVLISAHLFVHEQQTDLGEVSGDDRCRAIAQAMRFVNDAHFRRHRRKWVL